MRIAVLHQHRQLLLAGLFGLLAFAGGCGGGDGAVAPMPVQPPGIAPPPAGPDPARPPVIRPGLRARRGRATAKNSSDSGATRAPREAATSVLLALTVEDVLAGHWFAVVRQCVGHRSQFLSSDRDLSDGRKSRITAVELLVVIAIIAVLIALLLPARPGAHGRRPGARSVSTT